MEKRGRIGMTAAQRATPSGPCVASSGSWWAPPLGVTGSAFQVERVTVRAAASASGDSASCHVRAPEGTQSPLCLVPLRRSSPAHREVSFSVVSSQLMDPEPVRQALRSGTNTVHSQDEGWRVLAPGQLPAELTVSLHVPATSTSVAVPRQLQPRCLMNKSCPVPLVWGMVPQSNRSGGGTQRNIFLPRYPDTCTATQRT